LGKLAYCGINVAMILLGAVIGRRVFRGIRGLASQVTWDTSPTRCFKDSMIFPLALSLWAFAIIGLGVLWQRREAQWSAKLRGFLPGPLRELDRGARSAIIRFDEGRASCIDARRRVGADARDERAAALAEPHGAHHRDEPREGRRSARARACRGLQQSFGVPFVVESRPGRKAISASTWL